MRFRLVVRSSLWAFCALSSSLISRFFCVVFYAAARRFGALNICLGGVSARVRPNEERPNLQSVARASSGCALQWAKPTTAATAAPVYSHAAQEKEMVYKRAVLVWIAARGEREATRFATRRCFFRWLSRYLRVRAPARGCAQREHFFFARFFIAARPWMRELLGISFLARFGERCCIKIASHR